MKKGKKILSLFMTLIMIISIVPMSTITVGAEDSPTSGTCGEKLTWNFDESTGTLTISGTGEMDDYQGYSTEYNEYINNRPWQNCYYDIINVIINDGVTTIGERAFAYCENLLTITLPDSVNSIGSWSFLDCKQLTSITFPDSITYIGEWSFSGCDNIVNITLPDNLTKISDGVFSSCDSLTYLTIGNGITSIGEDAFVYCQNLTNVMIPTCVTMIGDNAFYGCTNLTSFTVDSNNQYYSSDENGVLFNKDESILIQYPVGNTKKSYTIPDNVISIGNSAFAGCTSLENVTIPDSVTTIGNSVFSNCTSLTSITIPDYMTSISDYAFSGCTSLTGIIIPDSIASIGTGSFSYCTNLASVKIGNNVHSIGFEAFYSCTKLSSITIPDSVTSICIDAFSDTAYYNDTSNWESNVLYIDNYLIKAGNDISGEHLIKDGIIAIAECAFLNCRNLSSISIPNSLTTIGHSAFAGCTNLTNITIPNSVTSIGNGAFKECKSLTSITIPDSITIINDNTFNSCYSLTNVIIPDSVASIGEEAFQYCSNLESVTIPDSVISIGRYAFDCCEKMTSVTIGSDITTIDYGAFFWCFKLTDVYYAGSEEQWNTVTISGRNDPLLNATIHYKKINSDAGVVLDSENYNVIPVDTKLNVLLLETKENSITYDITLTKNGTEIQPNGNVTVKIPVSNDLDGSMLSVYRAEKDGTYTNMNAIFDNGYMVFITDHFSKYIVTTDILSTPDEPIYNYTFSIQQPSRTEIRNKDGIILHAIVDGTAPKGSYVRWESSNGNFDKSADGSNLKIVAKNKGWTTFTAILCDADGNELARDSVEMYSKSGFFDKIGGFFRSLFGTTKIYDN